MANLFDPADFAHQVIGSQNLLDMMKFILENEKPTRKVGVIIRFGVCTCILTKITPIHLATCIGFPGVVETLAKKYGSPIVETFKGKTTIHLAATYGHLDIVKFLSGFTHTPNAPDIEGCTPIHSAALNGHLEVVKFLTEFTDNPNAPDKWGWTPIHNAVHEDHLDVLKFLVKYTDLPNFLANNRMALLDLANSSDVVDFLKKTKL